MLQRGYNLKPITYIRGSVQKEIVYIRGDGPVKEFNPTKAYIARAVEHYLSDGGKIRKFKRVLFEPPEIHILFEKHAYSLLKRINYKSSIYPEM